MPRRTYNRRAGRHRPTEGAGPQWIEAMHAALRRDMFASQYRRTRT